jgi:hypothetical protein
MFESPASCFAFRCSASLNTKETVGKQKLQANFQSCIDSTRGGFIVVAPGQFAIENFAARFKKTSACH